MTRYFTTLKGRAEQVPIEVEPLPDGRYAVLLHGERHEVDALRLDHGAVSLLIDGDSYHLELEEEGDEVSVLIRNQLCRIDVADERKLRLRAATAGFKAEGKQIIVAPMPGKIIKVLVQLGDLVREGQGLVVMEAMKMENELKSAKPGKVTELLAREGATVENNTKLVVVE